MPKKKTAKVKKAKAGKGKKDGKQDSKADKETDVEKSKATAALWELRSKVTDQSLGQYQEACGRLARVNEELTTQLYRAEKETIDVSAFQLKRDATREQQITVLYQSLRSQEARAREEQNRLEEDYILQIEEMKELFRKRSADFNMIEDGFKKIEAFQMKKAQMEQELSDIREKMEAADKEHRENLNKMEYRFYKEKTRLEMEAERAIALAVNKAHNEAIVQLDDASRSVFKENVRLNEALRHHMKEAEDLQKQTDSLARQNALLEQDKNTFEMMVKKNAAQMVAQKDELWKLRAKVTSLEQTLEQNAKEVEEGERKEKEKALVRASAEQVEMEKLQKVLAMRERELGHIKRLATSVVKQRTELEKFFHEALAQVKQEIVDSRQRYKKEALQAYRWKVREATAGKLKFPPIRTFHKSPHSTNSVHADMEAAAAWTHHPGSKVEISDLTWEQKEQVLRLLFARMNGQTQRRVAQHLALSASYEKKSLSDSDAAGIREQLSPATFITQAPELTLPSNPNSLPDIHTT
ncbi:basal body-orientation factor 1 [Cynoglossus semilaevis]|uniref:Basal body-orientation factor 1 n=1 Tax=Cynoglossus semilaevis TaxID=244447 RepID=A0A3P8UB71_CYNSE|nr:basal body-orientation factor 1 [Cynoglossus semilaevis]